MLCWVGGWEGISVDIFISSFCNQKRKKDILICKGIHVYIENQNFKIIIQTLICIHTKNIKEIITI